MNSETGGMELEVKETEIEVEIEKKMKEDGSATSSPSVVRWEKFLPQMVLRVLLVEADDSTRQIIAALLRKCSYKVAAVSDGLKAWEVLNERPHEIDLILTEVDIPSISGFALLTLIGEHEICKNIPVIMMSSQDSVSTVYKCMLKGAADFLVKPVRKNELKNLWQHVWRRQASSGGEGGPPEESVAQQKDEVTAENNAASNHSSGYVACIQRNRECLEKGSDAQSSCTKPDLEAEGVEMQHMQDISQPKCSKSFPNEIKIQNEAEVADASKYANTLAQGTDMDHDNSQQEHDNSASLNRDNNHVLASYSKEAIDLIGAFDSYLKCSYQSSGSINGVNKVDSSPLLDLSLRRSHPSSSVNQDIDERPRLNHSDASAFSRYINKTLQPRHSTSLSIYSQQKDCETNSDKQLSNQTPDYTSDTYGPTPSSWENEIPFASGQPGEAELAFPRPQQRVISVPVPVRGIRFENLYTAYGSMVPPIFCGQPGLLPVQSPESAGHDQPSFQVNPFHPSDPETRNSQRLHNPMMDQNANDATDQFDHKQGHKLESLEDRAHFSSATDQSPSSSFYNGTVSHFNRIGSGGNGSANPVPIVSGNQEGFINHEGNFHRPTQREAALTKFRLKRKDRCFEKKVRYESRKKLAEQRPRVKGQFVRHVHTELPAVETDNHCGNSFAS